MEEPRILGLPSLERYFLAGKKTQFRREFGIDQVAVCGADLNGAWEHARGALIVRLLHFGETEAIEAVQRGLAGELLPRSFLLAFISHDLAGTAPTTYDFYSCYAGNDRVLYLVRMPVLTGDRRVLISLSYQTHVPDKFDSNGTGLCSAVDAATFMPRVHAGRSGPIGLPSLDELPPVPAPVDATPRKETVKLAEDIDAGPSCSEARPKLTAADFDDDDLSDEWVIATAPDPNKDRRGYRRAPFGRDPSLGWDHYGVRCEDGSYSYKIYPDQHPLPRGMRKVAIEIILWSPTPCLCRWNRIVPVGTQLENKLVFGEGGKILGRTKGFNLMKLDDKGWPVDPPDYPPGAGGW